MNTIELRRKDFLNQYPLLTMMNKKYAEEMNEPVLTHLYMHIPFCYRKCDFCYYKSGNLVKNEIPTEYFNALMKELEMYADKNIVLRSMYWGGGTPTTMSAEQIEKILDKIYSLYKTTDDFEFCCEVRPGPEASDEKLAILKDKKIKRVSMGLQSLNADVLRINGRNHNIDMFYKAFERVKNHNIYSTNIDLMSGLIGDNQTTFMKSLEELVALGPENITIYKLQLYYNSTLYKRMREDNLKLLSDEEEFETVSNAYDYILSKGYMVADNFSFKKSEEYSHLHRVATWNGENMMGIGASSHSCVDNYIYQNEIDVPRYIEKIDNKQNPITRAYRFTPYEDMVRHFIFGIKSCNYHIANFEKKFGVDITRIFGDEIKWLEKEGYAAWNASKDSLITSKTGALYADDIIRAFFPGVQQQINMGFRDRTE